MSVNQYDDVFADIASRVGGIEPLLQSFFGFLHRKSDFYVVINNPTIKASMGFPPNKAKELLINSFESFPYKEYNGNSQDSHKLSNDNKNVVNNDLLHNSKNSNNNKTQSNNSNVLRYNDEGKLIPIGNGGIGNNYYWTQSLRELTVYIDVPSGTRSKDLIISLKPKHLSVKLNNNIALVEGELEFAIKTEESLWTLNISTNSNPQIIITLDKVIHTWWECVVLGHTRIDTSKVDSTQKIDEYDEETQSALRRIIYEQKLQKSLNNSQDENNVNSLIK